MDDWLTAALTALAAIGAWRYLVAFIGVFFETTLFIGLLVPGDSIVLLTSVPNRSPGEWALSVAAVVAGSLGGESLGYLIGAAFGPRIRVSRLGRRFGERQWLRAERWIDHRGGVAILLSRFLPVLHALVPVTVGASEYPYRRFIAWTAPACLAWTLIYVTVGTLAGSSFRALAPTLRTAGWVFFGVIALFLLLVWLGKRALHRLEHDSRT